MDKAARYRIIESFLEDAARDLRQASELLIEQPHRDEVATAQAIIERLRKMAHIGTRLEWSIER